MRIAGSAFPARRSPVSWKRAGLDMIGRRDLVPSKRDGGKLTVSLWFGRDRRVIADPIPQTQP